MNNKTLGTLALVGAPFLALGCCLEEFYQPLHDSRFTGLWGLVYISAWMCSIVALRRMEATGRSIFGKGILWLVLGTLVLADLSNLYQVVWPEDKSPLFWALDSFWPISNVLMLVVGITVLKVNGLPGWRRYVPLVVGLWLPFAFLMLYWLGRTPVALITGSLYSAVAWPLLAVAILTIRKTPPVPVPAGQPYAVR